MKLELSSEGRYALRALVYLARADERVNADTISSEAYVPRRLLARILARLSHAGLVESHAGRGGGSELALPPQEISLRDAVEAAEGPFDVTHCILKARACGEGVPCAMHDAWLQGQNALLESLEAKTLDGFIEDTVSLVDPRDG